MEANLPVLIFILKILIFNHQFELIESNQVQDAPIIEPQNSITIDVNEGKNVECKAKAPITWVFEASEKLHDLIKISHSEDGEGNFQSSLELTLVQVNLVGFYYCVFNSSLSSDPNLNFQEKVKRHEASSFYVYVNDPENKLYESDQYIIFGRQNESLVIPCKPNSPQVKVELVKDGDEGPVNGEYDPRIGYTVSFLDDEESGFFECRLGDDHEVYNEFQVIINGLETSDFSIKPLIISDSQNLAKNGASFSLSCHVEMISDAPYVVQFFLPNGKEAITTDYLTLSEIKVEDEDTRKSHRNLTIHNALNTRDEGEYKCTVKDIYNNIYSTVTKITFVDKPVVQLNPSYPLVNATKGQKLVKFHFNYFIYPKAKFEWYDPHNVLINLDQGATNDTKYVMSLDDDEISLTIKYPSIEDFGNYSLVAYTEGESFKREVKLVVSEKPACKMNDTYAMQGEETYLICECLAYPAVEIEWSFQPCSNLLLWPQCSEAQTDELISFQHETQFNEDTEYFQTSKIKFKATQPGTIKCQAKNNIGEDEIESKLQVVDLSAPILLTGVAENQEIAVGDQITLECGAIIYNYTDKINWLKNDKSVEESNDVHIKDSSTPLSYRKSLIFDSVKKEDEGEYKCEVYDREKNELHSLSTMLTFREKEPPTISTNFKQDNISEYSGNSLSLTCSVSGFPHPNLRWYKNGLLIDMNENNPRIFLKDNNMTLMFTELKIDDAGYYECEAENSVGKETKGVEINVELSNWPFNLNPITIISSAVIFIIILISSIVACCLCNRKKS